MDNYFNYFTEIEEHFCRRRGTTLLLSTLDWALIETWKDAGIPLEAVLRGVDESFDKYERRPFRTRKINSLAYCAQEVLSAAEDMKEAAVGSETQPGNSSQGTLAGSEIAAFFKRNASHLEATVSAPEAKSAEAKSVVPKAAHEVIREAAHSLRQLAGEYDSPNAQPRLEDLERRLTVMEEKLFAVLLAASADEELVALRAEADRELAPYRRKMPAAQIDQLQRQYVHKRLLERHGLPRLSLFYL
ncbi:MAG TPA: hypothetical protein VFA76_13895 [Terriglobales bacterium]|nr:hypothetical protein [Terriglobales bacterium]